MASSASLSPASSRVVAPSTRRRSTRRASSSSSVSTRCAAEAGGTIRREVLDRGDRGKINTVDDRNWYSQPRLCTHVDDEFLAQLTQLYRERIPPGGKVLDMCSSWISHYPDGYKAGRISGLGMNEDELKKNPILNDYVVRDLNEDPTLPFEDNTFDVVTNAVSVDYLTRPLEMMKEVNRVLKPGGLAVMSFSNRCFPTKAVSIWTSTGDLDHIWIVGAYYHFAGGFEPPAAQDISPKPGKSDPMYVVYARKQA